MASATLVADATVALMGLAVGIDALEWMWLRRHAASEGVLHVEPYPFDSTWICYALDLIQLLAAVGMILEPWSSLPIVSLTVITVIRLLGQANDRPGADGADQMIMIVLVSLLLFKVLRGEVAKQACLFFIGGQAVLCYTVAGLSKIASPAWRSGLALGDIWGTRIYGSERIVDVVRRHSMTARASNWAVILFECSVAPLVFAGDVGAITFSISGVLFHLGGAIVMRLYRFFWTMVATYPAVLYTSHLVTIGLARWNVHWWEASAASIAVVGLVGATVASATARGGQYQVVSTHGDRYDT